LETPQAEGLGIIVYTEIFNILLYFLTTLEFIKLQKTTGNLGFQDKT
jgi:hypothetical protein